MVWGNAEGNTAIGLPEAAADPCDNGAAPEVAGPWRQ